MTRSSPRSWPRLAPRSLTLLLAVASAGCPKGGDKPKPVEPAGRGDAQQESRLLAVDDGGVALPPAPALPTPSASLPPPADNPRITAEAVAFGELLFHDPRLSADGMRACATCHDPARGYAGGVDAAADGRRNLRRTPTLFNLRWVKNLGWDGRATSITDYVPAHAKGQLDGIDAIAARIGSIPTYRAHIARVGGADRDAIVQALEAYVLTRYEDDVPWDTQERTARTTPGAQPNDPIIAGYQLFTGKAQCAVCHTPPLYTDDAFHRVEREVLGDKGRGLVDPALTGAFKTPTLRGAMVRGAYFHSGSKKTMQEVIAHYQAASLEGLLEGKVGRIQLTHEEATQLLVFINGLTENRPKPQKPLLP